MSKPSSDIIDVLLDNILAIVTVELGDDAVRLVPEDLPKLLVNGS